MASETINLASIFSKGRAPTPSEVADILKVLSIKGFVVLNRDWDSIATNDVTATGPTFGVTTDGVLVYKATGTGTDGWERPLLTTNGDFNLSLVLPDATGTILGLNELGRVGSHLIIGDDTNNAEDLFPPYGVSLPLTNKRATGLSIDDLDLPNLILNPPAADGWFTINSDLGDINSAGAILCTTPGGTSKLLVYHDGVATPGLYPEGWYNAFGGVSYSTIDTGFLSVGGSISFVDEGGVVVSGMRGDYLFTDNLYKNISTINAAAGVTYTLKFEAIAFSPDTGTAPCPIIRLGTNAGQILTCTVKDKVYDITGAVAPAVPGTGRVYRSGMLTSQDTLLQCASTDPTRVGATGLLTRAEVTCEFTVNTSAVVSVDLSGIVSSCPCGPCLVDVHTLQASSA